MARSKIPSAEEHTRLWAKLSFSERRRFLKAVNRGEGMESRKEARLGVGVARQQQRYWRWAWLFGPAMGVIRIPDWLDVGLTALMGAVLMGALSLWRHRRAVEAERANLERLGVT